MIYLKKENETKFKKIYLKRKKSQKNSNLLKKMYKNKQKF